MSIEWNIETHQKLKSTQDIIRGMGEATAPEGMVVTAEEQTAGHGRHGRPWVSEKGNLYLSVLLRPPCKVQDIGQLAIVAGLTVAKTIDQYVQSPVIKWPNDVLIQDKKCAGILLETGLSESNALKYVVLGVGINVVSAPEEGTCLKDHTKKVPKLEALRDEFLEELNTCYSVWIQDGMGKVKEKWLDMAHSKGTPVTVKIGERVESGKFHDIDEQGSLLLTDDELRLKTITAGEVYI